LPGALPALVASVSAYQHPKLPPTQGSRNDEESVAFRISSRFCENGFADSAQPRLA
jgi:hypothetical protein